ncbi:MAG TPA: universal stress protein [Pseudonocardia sp.]
MAEQPERAHREPRDVVVGIDDSEPARMALAAAVEEAALRQAPLRVVAVFESIVQFGARYNVPVVVGDEEIAEKEKAAAREIVDEVLRTVEARTDVRVVAVPGPPGLALVEQAQTAQLLVVGHRGRGEVTSVLLGSVGLYCVLHAASPVLVVRPGPDA